MIFLLELKNCMDKNFFPDFFQKSLISLTFPHPLTNSLTFPDFADWMETLYALFRKAWSSDFVVTKENVVLPDWLLRTQIEKLLKFYFNENKA